MSESEDQFPPADAPVTGRADRIRLSRRAAMKAAVGGAVAAGVFVAPRVEGFSLVPDYASAASGVDGSDADNLSTVTSQAVPGPFCLLKCCITCWNATGVSTNCGSTTCACGTNKSCGNETNQATIGTLTINKNSPSGSSINLNYKLWGPPEGCTGPPTTQTASLKYVLAGIDDPFQHCDVAVTGTCGPPGTFGDPINGTIPPAHYDNDPSGTVTVSPAPICTGSTITSSPAASQCTAAATLTITLSCTFD